MISLKNLLSKSALCSSVSLVSAGGGEIRTSIGAATYHATGLPPDADTDGHRRANGNKSTEDQLISHPQSQNLHADLKEILGEENVTLAVLEGTGHGGPQFKAPANLQKAFGFLDKNLR